MTQEEGTSDASERKLLRQNLQLKPRQPLWLPRIAADCPEPIIYYSMEANEEKQKLHSFWCFFKKNTATPDN